jgi:hypothetical protein
MGRTRTDFGGLRRHYCSGESRHEHVHAGDAFVLHDLCAGTATSGTTNDGVNDPVSMPLGALEGQDTGVVHAIVGSATATPVPVATAAQSAASVMRSWQMAAMEALARG